MVVRTTDAIDRGSCFALTRKCSSRCRTNRASVCLKKKVSSLNANRPAEVALVVKKKWIDRILEGEKTWELRGCNTARRGWIYLAESKAGGLLVGCARLVDSFRVPKNTFEQQIHRHCVTNVKDVPYRNMFAWVLEDAERFVEPFSYVHPQGAVIWVRLKDTIVGGSKQHT